MGRGGHGGADLQGDAGYHRRVAPYDVPSYDPSALFNAVDLTGVVANALLGGAVARARRFDIVGFVILGICSGLGGGVLRDLLLGTGFPVALTHPAYLPAAVTASTAAYLLDVGGRWSGRLLALADVLALGCWAATGTLKSYGVGLGWLPCLLIGVLTAVGGGVIRDVLVARVPAVFGGNPLYATVALVGSAEMLVCAHLGQPVLGMALSIGTCGLLGVVARWRRWTLPGAVALRLPPSVASSARRYAVPRRRPAPETSGRPRRAPTHDVRSSPPGPTEQETP